MTTTPNPSPFVDTVSTPVTLIGAGGVASASRSLCRSEPVFLGATAPDRFDAAPPLEPDADELDSSFRVWAGAVFGKISNVLPPPEFEPLDELPEAEP
jgi:hypothetical protein